jgi:hypothetical protein
MSSVEQDMHFAPRSSEGHSKTLTAGWIEEFEFEARHFTKTERSFQDPDIHLNSMALPLEDLIDRGRRVEQRLASEASASSVHAH